MALSWSAPTAMTVPLGPRDSIWKKEMGGWCDVCSFRKTTLVVSFAGAAPSAVVAAVEASEVPVLVSGVSSSTIAAGGSVAVEGVLVDEEAAVRPAAATTSGVGSVSTC